ncbi:glutathione synthetase ATP-binding domain-like protein [Nemania sp. FL0031]|nr:glutathione synthetase ATP-binding domain-like protein [Nemania sp. FL0031]
MILNSMRYALLVQRAASRCHRCAYGEVQLRSSHYKDHRKPPPSPRVAVLYQALEPPRIDGVRKPKKPGGYQDSGADIAFNLRKIPGVKVITPPRKKGRPKRLDPADMTEWCFPDTEEGILAAIREGATHLWANTILFAAHPLQQSPAIAKFNSKVRVVGHAPLLVQKYDDKEYVNELLRKLGRYTMPQAWTIKEKDDIATVLKDAKFPLVAKPIRGRGSQGVKVCSTLDDLIAHAQTLREDSSSFMVEEFLRGEEVTVTVMPPTPRGQRESNKDCWSLPIVERHSHQDGVVPYNGVIAVVANSRTLSMFEENSDPHYAQVRRECERVGRVLCITAPIRIDCRRYEDSRESKFALFDVNMKPNMTGPGRPGRDDQASLTLMAAQRLGWDYPKLLKKILEAAQKLNKLKKLRPE